MGTTPTNAAFQKITSNNITDDYVQLIRGSDKTVLLWVDALGVIHAPNGIAGVVAGGAPTDIQVNSGGVLYADSGFTYNHAAGLVGIDTSGPSFSAPTITPAVGGGSTWGYVIVARAGNVSIALSPEGTTSTGTATLSGTDKNVITWLAVPGATAYDVYVSTVPGVTNTGYIATVSGLTYTDTGTPTAIEPGILPISESGYVSVQPGIHIGNMSWKDIWTIPDPGGNIVHVLAQSTINTLVEQTTIPPAEGDLGFDSPGGYGFAAEQVVAYSHGSGWSPTAINAMAICDEPDSGNGINGAFIGAVNTSTDSTGTVNWTQGAVGYASNASPGYTLFVLGVYGTAQNYVAPISPAIIGNMASVYGESFIGVPSAQIDQFSCFYGSTANNSGPLAGNAANTYVFHSGDNTGGPTDWSFYSDGGQNYFTGRTSIGSDTIAFPFETFAAPTVVPTPSGGSTTYTYTVNALRNNIVIAQSAVGTTTTGPATLDGSDYNTITWLAVPGADHYTVCDTGGPIQSAPVTGLTLNDIGAFTAVPIPSQGGFLYNPYGILIGDPLPDIAFADTPQALYNSLTAVSQLTVALDGAAHSSGVNDTINAGIAVSIFDTNTTGGLAGIIVGVEAVNDTTFAVGFWNDVALTNAPDASVPNGIANYSSVIAGYNNGDATEISCLNTNISNSGTGTVTLANGIHINQGSNAGTITELDGILIDDQTAYGGTVTNAYALHIEEQTTATVGSGNWAIKVESNGTDSQVELDGPFILGAATPTVTSGQLGLGTTTGFGNGITSAVTTTLIGTGTGPTNPQTVVNYIKINLGGTDYWMPLVQ